MAETMAPWLQDWLRLKSEMAEGYQQLAEQLEHFNNAEAARVFNQLADHQQQHIQRLSELASSSVPADPSRQPVLSSLSPADDINASSHYLMTPYHAVELALTLETNYQQTELEPVVQDSAVPSLRLEQAQHIEFLLQLLGQQPQPASHWHEDPDPPFLDD